MVPRSLAGWWREGPRHGTAPAFARPMTRSWVIVLLLAGCGSGTGANPDAGFPDGAPGAAAAGQLADDAQSAIACGGSNDPGQAPRDRLAGPGDEAVTVAVDVKHHAGRLDGRQGGQAARPAPLPGQP